MVSTMKTAVTVLQELMVKLGLTPEYECIAQSGPMHQTKFEYRCVALGVVVTASAHSKKDAKQEVARLMLQQLAIRDHDVPAPFGRVGGAAPPYGRDGRAAGPAPAQALGPASTQGTSASGLRGQGAGDGRSYVALLKELCEEFKLPAVEYELVGDTGPPHLRHFTMKARMGLHQRLATYTTKKMARQLAAEQLYSFLKENLACVTQDFNEEEALTRARERMMEKFVETRAEPSWRPDLGQQISEYHLGIVAQIEPDVQAKATAAAAGSQRATSPERALSETAAALGLAVELELEAGLALVALTPTAPELVFADASPASAAAAALRYLRRALAQPRPPPRPHPYPYPAPPDLRPARAARASRAPCVPLAGAELWPQHSMD